ncbi:MAG: hypothetical protein K0Q79_275 [Flavipsychrobacter sp.]|jgi:hypothetical protein|nr:hypothetical protein [Flavipsychrobacter sp.]
MGIFGNLFGGKKDKNFIPTTDVMNDEAFWSIIHRSYEAAKGDYEEQQEQLEAELHKLTPQDIILFDNKFRQLCGIAYNWQLWGAIYIINGGCGDDSFNDFRDWIVAQGKDFYFRTIPDPATLVDVNREKLEVEWEGMGYIPTAVFEEITGEDMPAGFTENTEVTGTEWDEENDDLQKMFPKLWEKYSNNPLEL